MTSYEDLINEKRIVHPPTGFDPPELGDFLYDFQRAITRWALRRGRAAIFADCGLGKTACQLEWAHRAREYTGGHVLILAPLAVTEQTLAEAEKFGIAQVVHVRDQDDVPDEPTISIANYERLHKLDRAVFSGIVLDESSILKSYTGHYRQALTEFARAIPYRLCCTATPAPNDVTELINHSEFLGILTGKEILALFFRQDGNTTHKWRLKGHAEDAFWRWLASWSVALRSPRDVGFDGKGFDLPPLTHHEHTVPSEPLPSMLFPVEASSMADRRAARKRSLGDRVKLAAEIVALEPDQQWLLWCNLNAESEALSEMIPDAVEVKGSDQQEAKAQRLLDFAAGKIRVLVSKPTIAGFGMNFQSCSRMVFVGLSDSYEQLYQAKRRCWRFGQKSPVDAHIVISEAEGSVLKNVMDKEKRASEMFDRLIEHVNLYQLDSAARQEAALECEISTGDGWTMALGDSYYELDQVEDDSVGLSVFSPPFPGMYAYTNSPHDVGNCRSIGELIGQLAPIMDKVFAKIMPGRSCCIHLTQVPSFKWIDGHVGLKDFRGKVIEMMEEVGFYYYGEVCIDKDPQVKAIRTKDQGLLFKTLATDASKLHQALADYLLQFKKPGENPYPIRAGVSSKYGNVNGWITSEQWIEWAAPVWYRAHNGLPGGIRETDVLNVAQARESKDERHLCPLQLGVIERAVKLWSNPGDLVMSPFAGIGSEGFESIRLGRRFFGVELKRSYWETACRNLQKAEDVREQPMLFPASSEDDSPAQTTPDP